MFPIFTILLAQNYTVLQQIGTEPASVSTTDLSSYLNSVFYAGLGVACGLAVIMIVIGGIQYMSTDAISGKEEGKERIQSALWGLLLALCSYLILYTIDPTILNTTLTLQSTDTSGTLNTSAPPYNPGVTNVDGINYAGSGGTYETVDGPDGNPQTVITTNGIAIDTDGTNPPPFNDPTYQSATSLGGLDANTSYYIVVPSDSSIPLGTPVTITNSATGLSVNAIVGDHGPAYGEISLAAATGYRSLVAW